MTILPNVPFPVQTHLSDAKKVARLLDILTRVNRDLLRMIPSRGNGKMECLAGAINGDLVAFGYPPVSLD